jgi:hypothetical protein
MHKYVNGARCIQLSILGEDTETRSHTIIGLGHRPTVKSDKTRQEQISYISRIIETLVNDTK